MELPPTSSARWAHVGRSNKVRFFDDAGDLLSIATHDGVRTNVSTASEGDFFRATLADDFGRSFDILRDQLGRTLSVTGPDGHGVSFQYVNDPYAGPIEDPEIDNLLSVVHTDGLSRTYHYEVQVSRTP